MEPHDAWGNAARWRWGHCGSPPSGRSLGKRGKRGQVAIGAKQAQHFAGEISLGFDGRGGKAMLLCVVWQMDQCGEAGGASTPAGELVQGGGDHAAHGVGRDTVERQIQALLAGQRQIERIAQRAHHMQRRAAGSA